MGDYMFFKKSVIILTVILVLCCFNAVNASDNITSYNNGPVLAENNEITLDNSEINFNEETVYYNPNNTVKLDLNTSECCSFIIQEANRETVYAFRQDSPLNGFGVKINTQEWNGATVLKQEIDTRNTYFFHSIITEDGWVMGQGGSQYDSDSRAIERIAGTIYTSNDISYDSLKKIQNVLYDYNYGHFVIKAPDGRYGIAFVDAILTGTLQQGQYMVIPNYYEYYAKGNYKSYGSDPVDAIINICSYDDSGLNRRNLYTYDYNAHETENGVYSGVDVFVTNDNGHNVGLDTSDIVTHFYYKGTYYPASSVPENPGKIYVGTHIFENQYVGKALELVEGQQGTVVGNEISLHYRVSHIFTQRNVIFDFHENVDLVSVSTSAGSYYYDSNNHLLHWQIPDLNGVKDIKIVIKPREIGNYYVHAFIDTMYESSDFDYYVSNYGSILMSEDVDKYKGGSERLVAYLYNTEGIPLAGEKVAFNINGQTYYREVENSGSVSLALNLGHGEYDAGIFYDGVFGKSQTAAKVNVRTTLSAGDIVKYYKNDTQFYASFLDIDGGPLRNSNVNFNINGIFYTRSTDENGVAKLNINLSPNEYTITSINSKTGEQISNSIIVKPVLGGNHDLVKYYRNDSKYSVKVLDGNGNPLMGASVTFNINGVLYEHLSDENGIASLSINLAPGNYVITASYNGASVSNNINVLTRLVSNDLVMHYKDGSQFKATVLDEVGRISPGENVTFNINGVFYNRAAENDGIAKLSINLLPGKYIITSYWNNYAKSNTITVLK